MKKLYLMALIAIIAAPFYASAVEWEITWPAGGTASSVDDVQIKCTEVAYRYLADDASATLYNASDEVVKTLVRDDITLSFKGSYCTVDFEFDPAITDAGTYRIAVPAGTFTTNAGDPNEAFSVNFTVGSSSYTPVDVTFTCAFPEGGVATSLENVMLTSTGNTWDAVGASPSGDLYDARFQVVASLGADNIFAYMGGVMIVFDPVITTPGQYMLILNEGSVIDTSAGATNAQSMVELTVQAATPEFNVSAMPEDGSTVSASTGIQAIYLTVDGFKYNAANTAGLTGSITKDGEAYATLDASVLYMGMDRSSAMVVLPEDAYMNTAGSYVVTLPQGFFTLKSNTDSEADAVDSPEIVLNYTISAPTEPLSWTVSPEPGEVEKIEQVTLTFNKPVKVATTSDMYLFYTNYSYLPETVTEGHLTVSDDGLTATIDFSPVFAQGGIFQIRFYGGNEQLSVVDGEDFPGINLTYKVNAPLYTECTPEEGTTVDSLEEVKIKLPRNANIAGADFSASFKQGDKVVSATLEKAASYDFGDPAYIVVKAAEAITTEGDVTLVIEAGSLTISNYGETMSSPEVTVKFNVSGYSGVDSISGTLEGNADIYSPQGVCLKHNAKAEDLRTLPAGLYIFGGRKVVVK